MAYMQGSGQISLNQIRSVWVSGPNNLLQYRSTWYGVPGVDSYGQFPFNNLTIRTFYGKGPNGQVPVQPDPPPPTK